MTKPMPSRVKKPKTYELEIVEWEGRLHCVYLNNFRIVGGKPWGGGNTVKSFSLTLADLKSAIPELSK